MIGFLHPFNGSQQPGLTPPAQKIPPATGLSTESLAIKALRVSRPNDGGQSITTV
jgi:hypothetical protein